MEMEDLSLSGGHAKQYANRVSQNYILETYIILLTNITSIHLIKQEISSGRLGSKLSDAKEKGLQRQHGVLVFCCYVTNYCNLADLQYKCIFSQIIQARNTDTLHTHFLVWLQFSSRFRVCIKLTTWQKNSFPFSFRIQVPVFSSGCSFDS